MSRLGLELGPTTIHGIVVSTLTRQPGESFDLTWNPAEPVAAVAALRARVGRIDDCALAIGLGFLHVARVELPPAPDAAREEMLALEPDRYFATNDPLQVCLAPGTDCAFGVDAAWLARVREAFAAWAPVTRVEASPVALARCGCPDGTWRIEAAADEVGLLTIAAGRLAGVRRTSSEAAASPLPPAPGRHAAFGAILREDDPVTGTLAGAEERRVMRGRRRRAFATAALAALAALAFLGASWDRSRTRTLEALDAEAARLAPIAAPALQAQEARLREATAQRLARAARETRPDIAGALAALGQLLPRDVIVTTVRATGREVQFEGTARNAAALVPLLDADPRFDNVRSLGASARFRDGRETRESFSIAFHAGTPD